MSKVEMKTTLGAYFAALGVSAAAASYAIPYIVGEKPVPTAVESALAESAARSADARTVTLVEAGKIAGVSRSTIFRLTKDGSIPTVNVRGKNRVRVADVLAVFNPSPAPAHGRDATVGFDNSRPIPAGCIG